MCSDENPRTNIMKRTILFITSLVLIVGCSKPLDDESLIDRGGVKYQQDSQKPYSGKVFSLYGNGQKEFEGSYKDGKRDGLWFWLDDIGQKYKEETYKDGELDGLWTYWNYDGQKIRENTYKDDELISSKCWSDDGEETHCDDEENW